MFIVLIYEFLLSFLQCSEIHSFSRTCLLLSVCLCIFLSMCVKRWVCMYRHVCCMCASQGDLPEQLGMSLVVDFVDFVSKIQLPNTFRRCVLWQDAHSAQSQQQLEPCMYGWMYICTYKCMYVYMDTYLRGRAYPCVLRCTSSTHQAPTGVNETSLLHAPLRLSKWNQSGIFKASLIRLPPSTRA